jgi:hypothetical protein
VLASLTELKKQKEKNKKNLKKKEQQEKEKKAKRKREGAKINRNRKTQQGKEEEKERNERMRTIAIASYFSRDFKKSIELDDSLIQPIPELGGCWLCSKFSSHEQESPHSLVPESCVDRKRVNHTQLATKKHGIGKKIRVSRTTGFSSS